MLIDLDKLKAEGGIPVDLDSRMQKIIGLPEMCDGHLIEQDKPVLRLAPYDCSECAAVHVTCNPREVPLENRRYSRYSFPHTRIPKPYSTDLVASRDVLAWLLTQDGTEFELSTAHRYDVILALLFFSLCVNRAPHEWADVQYQVITDEALALAVAVNALFGEKE